jgi:hypothetical protein
MDKDKQKKLLIQVIHKLTAMSNQAIIANIELLQEKNTLKSEVFIQLERSIDSIML